MPELCLINLSPIRSRLTNFFPIFLLVIIWTLPVFGQIEFTSEELEQLKEQKRFSHAFKYRLSQDKFSMPESAAPSRSMMADGELDPTFNASVTEGFGYVQETLIQPDGKILAVGLFQRANGARVGGIARFNPDGTLDTSFNAGSGADSPVLAVALQPDGRILIGGVFNYFNGRPVNRIARLNADGSFDSTFDLSVPFTGQINDILILPDGKIMVGGFFNVASSNLVRLNPDGSLDAAFPDFNGAVTSLALAPDGKIVVGGTFLMPTRNIARLNSDGTLDATFVPAVENARINQLLVQPNGKILAAGFFFSASEPSVSGLKRFNENGSLDATFEITSDPLPQNLDVFSLALQTDGKVLASFYYIGSNGQTFADVKRFNADGTPDNSFNTGNGDSFFVTDLTVLNDGKILAGGSFVSFNNQPRLRLIKLNPDGTADNNFNAAVSTAGIVYAIKRQADGRILIGGDFEYVNGVRKSAVARLNPNGSLDNSFTLGAGFTGDVYAIETQPDGRILIGGIFSRDANFSRNALARLNPDGSLDRVINFSGGNRLDVVYAIGVQADGKILAAGMTDRNFQRVAATRINPDGTLDTSFNAPPASLGTLDLLLQPDGRIIVGVIFLISTGGGNPHIGIARLNADGTLDMGFEANVGNVYALAQQSNGNVFAGGVTLTKFSPEGVPDPSLNVGSGFKGLIRALQIQRDGKILLGGSMTGYRDNPANRLIRLNPDGSLDTSFNANPSGIVYALDLQPNGKILVGGQFLDFNGVEKFSLVRLQNTSNSRRAPFDFDGDGKTDISIFRPASGEWWYQLSSTGQVPSLQFGSGTDKPVPADYTGDGKTDFAFWRPSTGEWFVLRSENGSFYSFPFGSNGDLPTVGDFDADGRADAGVFRPASATWFIQKSSGGTLIQQFGASGDKPVPADYDGDCVTDLAVFRPGGANGAEWWINRTTSGLISFQFGSSADKAVPADYTGDGRADAAFFQPSTGFWYILRSEDFSYYAVPFGAAGDIAAAGDYDGDSRTDLAVFRPSNSTWFVQRSTGGTLITAFGATGDFPVPNSFVP